MTLIDYADNETKVWEAIQELEVMFPAPKAEDSIANNLIGPVNEIKTVNSDPPKAKQSDNNDKNNTNGNLGPSTYFSYVPNS